MALNAKDILTATDRPVFKVHVPEWATAEGDDVVCLRLPNALDEFEVHQQTAKLADQRAAAKDQAKKNHIQFLEIVHLVAACIVDGASGAVLMGDQDVEALSGKSPVAVNRCYAAIIQQQIAENKVLKELAKNVAGTVSGASGCDSPSTAATDTPA